MTRKFKSFCEAADYIQRETNAQDVRKADALRKSANLPGRKVGTGPRIAK